MRVRRAVVRVELTGCAPARADALARAALAQAAADTPGSAQGRIGRLRIRVDAGGGDAALAARIARAISAAISERAGG